MQSKIAMTNVCVAQRRRPEPNALANVNRKAGVSRPILPDWAAIAVLLFEIPSLLLSEYPGNSLQAAQAIGLAVLSYFLVRLIVRSSLQATIVALAIGVGGAIASCVAAYQFFTQSRRLKELGFTDLIAFRSRLVHPLSGWVPGEWFTIFLLTLPFGCAATMYLHKRYSSRAKLSTAFAIAPAILIIGGVRATKHTVDCWRQASLEIVRPGSASGSRLWV